VAPGNPLRAPIGCGTVSLVSFTRVMAVAVRNLFCSHCLFIEYGPESTAVPKSCRSAWEATPVVSQHDLSKDGNRLDPSCGNPLVASSSPVGGAMQTVRPNPSVRAAAPRRTVRPRAGYGHLGPAARLAIAWEQIWEPNSAKLPQISATTWNQRNTRSPLTRTLGQGEQTKAGGT
jgi:hypothetical protein